MGIGQIVGRALSSQTLPCVFRVYLNLFVLELVLPSSTTNSQAKQKAKFLLGKVYSPHKTTPAIHKHSRKRSRGSKSRTPQAIHLITTLPKVFLSLARSLSLSLGKARRTSSTTQGRQQEKSI
eukprot:2531583-Amphidinium_carterae.1